MNKLNFKYTLSQIAPTGHIRKIVSCIKTLLQQLPNASQLTPLTGSVCIKTPFKQKMKTKEDISKVRQ